MDYVAPRQYCVITPEQAAAIDALATVTVEDIERSRIVPQLDALRVRLANGYNLAVTAPDAAQSVPGWSDLIAVIEAA